MPVELKLEPSGDAAIEMLRSKADVIVAALSSKLNELMLRLQSKIVGEKLHGQDLNQRTGKTAASIRAIPVEQQGTELVGAVEGGGGPAFYFRFQNDGSAPHVIVPVNKKALAFQLDGKTVFAKMVHHPGTQAKHIMENSLAEFEPTIVSEMQGALNEAAT